MIDHSISFQENYILIKKEFGNVIDVEPIIDNNNNPTNHLTLEKAIKLGVSLGIRPFSENNETSNSIDTIHPSCEEIMAKSKVQNHYENSCLKTQVRSTVCCNITTEKFNSEHRNTHKIKKLYC
jgi:hypothetical protein